jgi:UDP-N-acetylglucosamine transferase subunit ALG13
VKIFVTVGTQLPFDRLVRTVDEWCGGRRANVEAFAQIGPARYQPRHIEWKQFIAAGECRRRVEDSDAVIAHAGMGSIITALELGKPIVVMPRRAELNEHRNEHQLATARSLLAQGKVIVAFDEAHLLEKLDHLQEFSSPRRRVANHASPRLIEALRQFIHTGEYRAETCASAPAEIVDGIGHGRPLAGERSHRHQPPKHSPILIKG